MNNVIYYFSGTGNSLYVAQKIQERLKDAKLVRIHSGLPDQQISVETDTLGIVFPVYAWGPPIIVEDVLKRVNIAQPNYLFVVATHAGGPRNCLKYVERLFRKKGLTLHGAFDMTMPSNFVTGANPPAGKKLQSISDSADAKLTQLIESITQKEHRAPQNGNLIDTLFSSVIHRTFKLGAKRQGKKFSVTEACTHCGVCVKTCPVDNISLSSDNRPVWQNRCEFCLACINWCPTQAIQSGNSTQSRNRYHHSAIKIAELMRQENRS